MAQLNLQLTKEFLKDLRSFMQLSGIQTKSEAIRVAVKKALYELLAQEKKSDFRSWLGMGLKAPLKDKRKFVDEDSLWERDS